MKTRIACLLGLILYTTSCAIYRTQITSNVDNNHQLDLKKISLIVESSTKTTKFLNSLMQQLEIDFEQYGVDVRATTKNPLSLKSEEGHKKDYEKMLTEYQPDAIFTIQLNGMENYYEPSDWVDGISSTNRYSESDFLLSIGKLGEENFVWKAIMTLNAGGNLTRFSKGDIQRTSLKIIERLKSDGILQ